MIDPKAMRKRVELKKRCYAAANLRFPPSEEDIARHERSKEATGYAEALFEISEHRMLWPPHDLAQGIGASTPEPSSARSTAESPTPLGDAPTPPYEGDEVINEMLQDAPKADRERSVGLSEEEIWEIGNKLACDPQFSGHYRNGHMEGVTKALRYARDHFSKLGGEQVEKIIHAVMAARAWCKDKDMPDTAAYFEACVRDAIKAANLYP